jgi:hypothetical protein
MLMTHKTDTNKKHLAAEIALEALRRGDARNPDAARTLGNLAAESINLRPGANIASLASGDAYTKAMDTLRLDEPRLFAGTPADAKPRLRRGRMSDQQKAKYIGENGMSKYLDLPE